MHICVSAREKKRNEKQSHVTAMAKLIKDKGRILLEKDYFSWVRERKESRGLNA